MAIKDLSALTEDLKKLIADETSDEAIAFMEDLTDTMTDYQNKTKDEENWKEKYQENDKEWRKKYLARFSNKPVEDDEDDSYDLPDPPKKTYLDLFSEVKPNG